MNPITRMMKRYINLPLKKALPLLFVCVILLTCVGITGCGKTATSKPKVGYTEMTEKYPTEMGNFKVKLGITRFEDGTRLEHLETEKNYVGYGEGMKTWGGEWFKTFNQDGKLIMEIWKPFYAP